MARHRVLRVILPADWHELPGRSPREYRRKAAAAGVLQLSFQPPLPELQREPERLLPWLQEFIRQDMPELQVAVQEGPVECKTGPCAFSLRRSTRYGLKGLWVIPAADVVVFATYIMGSPDTVIPELEDAMMIVQSAYFEDGDGDVARPG